MKISKGADYALLAVGYLASSSNGDQGKLVNKSELVTKLDLPKEFLSQILQRLKASGLLRSVRGKYGGYMLTKPVTDITFLEVIEALDGKLSMVQCFDDTITVSARFKESGTIRQKMSQAQVGIGNVLNDITFDQISMDGRNEI